MSPLQTRERSDEQSNAIAIARIEERLSRMAEDLHSVKKEIEELNAASARVKGGLFVVLFIGGIIGWLTTIGTTFFKMWPFH